MKAPLLSLIVSGGVVLAPPLRAVEDAGLKFAFGPKPVPGAALVKPEEAYNVNRGYGYDLGSKVEVVNRGGADPLAAGFTTGASGRPFFFSTKLGPGAYRVTITLGDATQETVATVKSETRRLMLEAVHVPAGQTRAFTFLVHVRVPQIPGDGMVALKAREKEPILYVQWDENDPTTRLPFLELDWDERLTLEFSDAHPALCAVDIADAGHPPTVYLVGDSTMTDQMMEPWAAWGQMFPRWFKSTLLVANYAESGESARSFLGERRWPKLMSEVQAGDFVLIQFGINDRGTPLDQFKQYFRTFVTDTRAHGATPVLVTSQNLRKLGEHGEGINTLGGYPDAMREVAAELTVPLIDLNVMSMKLYAAIGPDELPKMFVDGTHQNDYGAYQLAKCVVQGVIDAKLPFAAQVVDDWKPFDPAHPDAMAEFKLPRDPQLDPSRPGGPGAPGRRGPMAGDARPAAAAPAKPAPAPSSK